VKAVMKQLVLHKGKEFFNRLKDRRILTKILLRGESYGVIPRNSNIHDVTSHALPVLAVTVGDLFHSCRAI
jgi:hypothetical protein